MLEDNTSTRQDIDLSTIIFSLNVKLSGTFHNSILASPGDPLLFWKENWSTKFEKLKLFKNY